MEWQVSRIKGCFALLWTSSSLAPLPSKTFSKFWANVKDFWNFYSKTIWGLKAGNQWLRHSAFPLPTMFVAMFKNFAFALVIWICTKMCLLSKSHFALPKLCKQMVWLYTNCGKLYVTRWEASDTIFPSKFLIYLPYLLQTAPCLRGEL